MTSDRQDREERLRSAERGSVAPAGRKPYTSPKLTRHGAIAKSTAVSVDAVPSLPR